MLNQYLTDTYRYLTNTYMIIPNLTDLLLYTDTKRPFNPNQNLPIFNSYLCLHS